MIYADTKFHSDRFLLSPVKVKNPNIWLYFELRHFVVVQKGRKGTAEKRSTPGTDKGEKKLKDIGYKNKLVVCSIPNLRVRFHSRSLAISPFAYNFLFVFI